METKNPGVVLRKTISTLSNEISLTRYLLRDNFTAHCGNAIACLITRLSEIEVTFEQLLDMSPRMMLAIFAFAYTFDIANQAFSVEEDSINKPDRPIPSGKMSVKGAYTRWMLSWSILPMTLYLIAGPWAVLQLILWEIWTFGFYIWPKCDNWVARNTFTAVGAVTQLSLLDAVIAHGIPQSEFQGSLGSLLFCWLLATIHVQEFHDMEGDRISGRQTLPLLMGPRSRFWLRVATALLIGVTVIVNVTSKSTGNFEFLSTLGLFHVLSMLVLAVRLVMLRTKEADKVTYKYYYTLATYIMLLFRSHSRAATI